VDETCQLFAGPPFQYVGFVSLKKKLTGTQLMIILIMKPLQALASQNQYMFFCFTITCYANVFLPLVLPWLTGLVASQLQLQWLQTTIFPEP